MTKIVCNVVFKIGTKFLVVFAVRELKVIGPIFSFARSTKKRTDLSKLIDFTFPG